MVMKANVFMIRAFTILTFLSLAVACTELTAQISFNVRGEVRDAVGMEMVNIEVEIEISYSNSPFSINDTVYTDSSGQYSRSYVLGQNASGSVDVRIRDCPFNSNGTISDSTSFSPADSFVVSNFTYCADACSA